MSSTYPNGYSSGYAAAMPTQPQPPTRASILDAAARRRVGVLAYVAERIADGRAPSVADISAHTGMSERTTKVDLLQLEAAGWLTRTPGVHRGLQVTEAGLLFLAERTAGGPRLAVVR